MNIVGKDLYGIEHYWVRFEFAKGRGQIHAHLLAITKQNPYMVDYYKTKDESKKVQLVTSYVRNVLDMTADHPAMGDKDKLPSPEGTACIREARKSLNKRFSQATDEKEFLIQRLNATQYHMCNGYCLTYKRIRRQNNTGFARGAKRYCRFGAGTEMTTGVADTEGFPLTDEDSIKMDDEGRFKIINLRRTSSRRMLQTSTSGLLSWGGNMDIKMILYPEDPVLGNIDSITGIINYAVAYNTKGSKSESEELQQMTKKIMNAQTVPSEDPDSSGIFLTRQLMNDQVGQRVISKAECVSEILLLPHTLCSEKFLRLSLSTMMKIKTQKEIDHTLASSHKTKDNEVEKYASRKGDEHLSLIEYCYQKYGRDNIVLNPTGLNYFPEYPFTYGFARGCLILYKPWSNTNELDLRNVSETLKKFKNLLRDPSLCPEHLTIKCERAKREFVQKKALSSQVGPLSVNAEGVGHHHEENDHNISQTMTGYDNNDVNVQEIRQESLPIGVDFDWSLTFSESYKPPPQGPHNPTPDLWLHEKINEYNMEQSKSVFIPKQQNGLNYSHESLNDKQYFVFYKVIQKIREWIVFVTSPLSYQIENPFSPLRMTINGAGGTGKTHLIKTIMASVRHLFMTNNVVQTATPTGMSAFHVFAKTIHLAFGINATHPPQKLSMNAEQDMAMELTKCLVIILDEKSMISCELLAMIDKRLQDLAYKKMAPKVSFGGVPVVLVFGDENQLPSVEKKTFGRGPASVIFGEKMTERSILNDKEKERRSCEIHGAHLFQNVLTQYVCTLTKSERILENESHLHNILENLSSTGTMTDEQANLLLQLHIDRFSTKDRQEIERNSIYVMATNHDKTRQNMKKLKELANELNPVCILPCKYNTTNASDKNRKPYTRHFADDESPSLTTICTGCLVAISGKNFNPAWGLHNGSIGKVQHIHFNPGQNPNNGDLPLYVVVSFATYRGPIWDVNNPTFVPIPILQNLCSKKCCTKTFCPLTLAHARTIHKFQGQQAGKTQDGKPKNATTSIIVCPGSSKFEGMSPGLLYTALGRATTLGGGNLKESAIFFTGDKVCEDRLTNVWYKRSPGRILQTEENFMYTKVSHRNKWKRYLAEKESNIDIKITNEETAQLNVFLKHQSQKPDCLKQKDLGNMIQKYISIGINMPHLILE